jgi:hypothetical protein
VSRGGHLRASDADREHIVDRLRKAATEGRIAAEELEHRVSAALKARTYGELDATVADLPGPRSRAPQPQRRSTIPAWMFSTVRANPILLIFIVPVVAVTAAMVIAATVVWLMLVCVVMVVGGHRGMPRPPWYYSRRYGPPRPPRRGPGGYWA